MMKINDDSTIMEFRTQVIRLVNLYNKLENMPLDTGFGDCLYPAEIHMIEAIRIGNGDTVTALSLHFRITKGAVSQTITKLIGKGYLSKTRDLVNKKTIIIALTKKGEKVFSDHEQFHKRMDNNIGACLHEFPIGHIMAFKQMIKEMIDHVEKYIILPEKKF